MANFQIAFEKYILPNEGGYAFVPGDKGGETYAGISRVYFPTWKGWDFIDRQKKPIKNNTKFHELDSDVRDFYYALWNDNNFGLIKSQEVANIFFDFFVNSANSAIKAVQKLLGLPADGHLGSITLGKINSLDPASLHDKILQRRKEFYQAIVNRDPSQQKFLSGWLRRLDSFPTLVKAAGFSILILVALLILVLINI